ncbi:hypothetical protein M199_gp002 [Halogranum tailed virus 1]|uniref:Uncharacterized protein n=1 Tax=Halogranum tailed virus 1 TaxID=1273749 RepID=R4TKY1_9CAUD|nr:hypothetical protein M199_gp002 [Halogranum tailed virus 1]AGM11332.1 hypothetical protein HGTV1_2 [Halogranum tailed virus 1]
MLLAMSEDIHFDSLDREEGNGSRNNEEDWMDGNSRIQDNKWTTSRTTFWPTDVDGQGKKLSDKKRRKFKELRKKHDRFAGEDENYNRKTTIRYGHIMNDVYTFCNICDLPKYQTEAVASIIKDSDISSNNYGGKNYEKIVLAVMSLIVDRDIDDTDNLDQRLILQDEFRDLMDNNKMGSKELRKVRQMVRERVDIHSERL